MREENIDTIISKAKELKNENKKWHFHMLSKDCHYNEHKGKFCIIFESENETLFATFDEKPLEKAKKLADLMYGEDFLDKQEKDEHNPDFDKMFERAKEMDEKGIGWHHHHLHPNCIFNEHKGKHCIVLEDEINHEVLITVYDRKPMEDLVKLEKIFYKDLE